MSIILRLDGLLGNMAGTGYWEQVTLALKLPLAASTDAQANLAFQREHEALNELRHPNIVQLVDSGRTEHDELFLALEWLAA